MLEIKPYFPNGYDNLLPFLKKFNPEISERVWKNLLEYKWDNKLKYVGMLLVNDDEIVGFLSYILSSAKIATTDFTFCNISSWVVNHEFRSQSLKLLGNILQTKNVIVMNLSPHINTLSIFNALRFELLSEFDYIINPFKIQFALFNLKPPISFSEITTNNIDSSFLNDGVKKIIIDHAPYENVHFYKLDFLNKGRKEQVVLAFNLKNMPAVVGLKNIIKELPYNAFNRKVQFELLYSSDVTVLQEKFSEIMYSIVKHTPCRVVIVSEHFLNKKDCTVSFTNKSKKDRPWFIYSDGKINYTDMNVLYSEKVLLNF